MKKKVYELAAKHGCTIEVYLTNRIECTAPAGRVFRSCDSQSISVGGDAFGTTPPDWAKALGWFKSEIAEGFEDA